MVRKQVNDLPGPELIQPQATPVDTYYQPAMRSVQKPPNSNPMLELAKSLSQVHPQLQHAAALSAAGQKQSDEESVKLGMALAAQNRMEWSEFIKLHPEYTKANPWVRFGFERYQVLNKARAFDLKVRTQWASDPIRNNDDLNAFDEWFNQQQNQFLDSLQGTDPRIVAETLSVLQSSRQSLQNEHINYRQKVRYEGLKSGFSDTISNLITDHYGSQSLDKIANVINTEIDEAILNGLSEQDAVESAIDAYINSVRRFDTHSALDLLSDDGLASKIVVKGKPISRTNEFRERAEVAENRIIELFESEQRFRDWVNKKEKEEEVTQLKQDIYKTLENNPYAPLKPFVDRLIQLGEDDEAFKWMQYQKQLQTDPLEEESKIYERPDVAADLIFRAYKGDDVVSLARDAYANKQILKGTLDQVIELSLRHQSKESKVSPLFNKNISSITKEIKSRLKPAITGIDPQLDSMGDRAVVQFYDELFIWEQTHPNANEYEKLEQAKKIRNEIIQEYEKQLNKNNTPRPSAVQQRTKPKSKPKTKPKPKSTQQRTPSLSDLANKLPPNKSYLKDIIKQLEQNKKRLEELERKRNQ